MLETAVIYLAAALIAVPIAKRIGLGSVLGYLLAGIFIGPSLLSLVGDQSEVMHIAEYGVVMMLFLVGLELQPSRLWKLRHSILGLGGLQVLITAGLIMLVCVFLFSLRWQAALSIGLMLALSSTAIVLQTLAEKDWTKLESGQNSFSVLLFQDIAVIPILALLPLLAFEDMTNSQSSHGNSFVEHLSAWQHAGVSVLVIIAIIFAGKYISAPLFRYIAETRLREIFTVFALFLVISIAYIMQVIGLSPALGTFLAGVVLAESEFRHELEVDIEPFKGLLLGLFFITVGASIDFPLLVDNISLISMLVIGLIIIKVAVLYVLATVFKLHKDQKMIFTLILAQGGEFAFVLVTLTGNLSILTAEQTGITTLVVAMSMLSTPILLLAHAFFTSRRKNENKQFDSVNDMQATEGIIVAGYGRFGQVIGRLLQAQGYHLSILDHSPAQIDLLRGFGNEVFYGDAARLDLLVAAGANEAKMLVIAIDDPDKILEIIELSQKHFKNLKIVTRAIDRRHAYQLIKLNVDTFKRETFDSAVSLGIEALKMLGNESISAIRAGQLFSEHDDDSMLKLAEVWGDDKSYGVAVKQRLEDLKQVLDDDRAEQDKLNTCSKTKEKMRLKELNQET